MIHALSWAEAHPLVVLVALWLLVSIVVAVTPTRYRSARWYGWLVRLAERLSLLTHPDTVGTLKLPGVTAAIDPRLPAVLEVVERGKPGHADTGLLGALAIGLVIGSAFALALLSSGCSSTQVHREALSVDIVSRAANVALPNVIAEYEREGHAAIVAACCDQPRMEAALAEVDRRWSPALAAWELTRVAHGRLRTLLMRCQTDPATVDAGTCALPGFAEASAEFLADLTSARCALHAIGRADLDVIPGGPPACPSDGGAS